MKSNVKVVFGSRFTLPFNSSFYKYKDLEKVKQRVTRKYDYFANKEKRVMNLYDYFTGKINKEEEVNLVLEDGTYATEKELEKRKKDILKYMENSIMWQGFISFNNDYINKNITIKDLEKELAKNVLPAFFRKMGFKDPKKMMYNFSLHSNTDNLHFHISFCEKEPNYINCNNNICYRKKGIISQEELNFLKNEISIAIERGIFIKPLLIKTNEDIEKLKKYFKSNEKNFILYDKKDLIYEEKILRLGKLLYSYRENTSKKIKYNSIYNKEIRELTKEIKKYIFAKNSNFNIDYKKFKNTLRDINKCLYKINMDNHVSNIILDKTLTKNKEKYLNNFIMNQIVNYARLYYKTNLKKYNKINESELLQKIILNEYKKNTKLNKYFILENYLTKQGKDRFVNKYKVEQAINKINEEMKEAQYEFSKLFVFDDYDKK